MEQTDFLRELGSIAVVTRLKRVSDAMLHDGRRMYKDLGMDIEPNWFAIFRLLEKYDVLIRRYLDAVVRMHQGEDLPLSGSTVLYDVAMGANDLCQHAEDSIRSHIEEHGC